MFMTESYPKFLKKAYEYSLSFNYDDDLEYHHCAVLVKGGSIIGAGYNNRSTTAFVEHYADLARGLRHYCLSTHAELDVIQRYRRKVELDGCKIYVFRRCFEKKLGMAAMSRPCPICELALKNYGISRAVYSIDDDHFGTMTPGSGNRDKITRTIFKG